MKMPIVSTIDYWPAKFFNSEEEQACMEHENKLYGPVEMKEKEWEIERLVTCSQWEGNSARTMSVLKIPKQHLNDWIMDYAKRNTIYFMKLEGFDSAYEIWASNEELGDIFKDEPFFKKRMNFIQTLTEKYGKPE